jgi:hypothetical protein
VWQLYRVAVAQVFAVAVAHVLAARHCHTGSGSQTSQKNDTATLPLPSKKKKTDPTCLYTQFFPFSHQKTHIF